MMSVDVIMCQNMYRRWRTG